MAKMTKTQVDKSLREGVFEMLLSEKNPFSEMFYKVNDRQYGIIMVDPNGDHRYCRIPVIVAEIREDMTAEELMQSEIDAYEQKQADKTEKAKAKEAKIAKDKARRAKEAEAKEKGE